MRNLFLNVSCLLLLSLITPASTQCIDNSTIQAQGESVVPGIPDTATIYVRIAMNSSTATQATNDLNQALNLLQQVVSNNGVPPSNVQNISVNIRTFVSTDQCGTPATVYESSQLLSVRVDSIGSQTAPQISILYDQLNLISGVTLSRFYFEISNRVLLQNQARLNAFSQAKKAAQIFSALAGFRLSSIKNIVEEVSARPKTDTSNLEELMSSQKSLPGVFDIRVKTVLKYNLL